MNKAEVKLTSRKNQINEVKGERDFFVEENATLTTENKALSREGSSCLYNVVLSSLVLNGAVSGETERKGEEVDSYGEECCRVRFGVRLGGLFWPAMLRGLPTEDYGF